MLKPLQMSSITFFANIDKNLANSIKVTDISYKDFFKNPQSSSLFRL